MTPTDFFDWLRDQGALDAFIENAGFAVVTQLMASKNQVRTKKTLKIFLIILFTGRKALKV